MTDPKDRQPDSQEPLEPQDLVDEGPDGNAPDPGRAFSGSPVEPGKSVQQIQAEYDDILGRLQRVTADYGNYQRRVQRELVQAREYANESLLRTLLPILDDMELGLRAGRENHPANDPLLVGMQMVHDKAMDVLAKSGLSRIEALGQPFDPDYHQALMHEVTDECDPMTVIRELQPGYLYKGRTLRPASVVVAKAPGDEGIGA